MLWGLGVGVIAGDGIAEKPVFHFDFKDAARKHEIADLTGKFKCISGKHDFVIEKNALRVAPCAEIYIPCGNLPDYSRGLTLSVWVLKRGEKFFNAPFLTKGAHGDVIDFTFGGQWKYPVFWSQGRGTPNYTGIYTQGHRILTSYPNEKWFIKGGELLDYGKWQNITGVFDRDTIKIYVDGKLTSAISLPDNALLTNTADRIYIGSEKIKNFSLCHNIADILINDIRLYNRPLSAEAVKKIFADDKNKYDVNGKQRITLSECNAYPIDKAYDPKFEKKLKITREYEERILPGIKKSLSSGNTAAEVKKSDGQVELTINNVQRYPILVYPFGYDISMRTACIRDFAAADINLVTAPFFTFFYWLKENEYDFKHIDKVIKDAIIANPKAKINVSLLMSLPGWFMTNYPDDAEIAYFGKNPQKSYNGPLGSDKWLDVSRNMLKAVVSHIESSDYASHVFGYLIGGGGSAEWYWPESVRGAIPGYSKATAKSFREWLRKKYHNNVAELRNAWKNSAVTFESVQVPSLADREKSEYFLFRKIDESMPVFDFRRYMTDRTVMFMNECARSVKEASGFKKLVFVYTGYTINPTKKKLYNSGLLGTLKIYQSPYIDCVANPQNYGFRRPGQSGLMVSPFSASALLHGKLPWQEDDLRTHFSDEVIYRTENLRETIEVVRRGFGYSLTRNMGFWWAPFNPASFHQEELMREVAEIKKLADAALREKRQSTAEVAFIYDENALFYLGRTSSNFLDAHAWGAYDGAVRMGAPFDFYFLDDLKEKAMPDYKLYIFLNAFRVVPDVRQAIIDKLKKNNAVAVWCYAPGFISDTGFSAEAMRELTGMKLEAMDKEIHGKLIITDKNNPITGFADAQGRYPLGPVFAVNDSDAKVLGTVDGNPALAVKELEQWRSVYSLMPLSKELLMGLCDYAGVHVYSRSFDVLFANRNYLMLHTSSPGRKTITLPDKSDVTDIFTDKTIGRGIDRFTEDIPKNTTRIYKLIRPGK